MKLMAQEEGWIQGITINLEFWVTNSANFFRIYIAFDVIIETHLRKELDVEWIQKVFCFLRNVF